MFIGGISFDHRPFDGNANPVYNDYSYDDLNRLTDADNMVNDYSSTNEGTESFVMDDLGNRTSATLRGESNKTYAVNDLTNRYDEAGTFDIRCSYDNAGNTIIDQNGYQYTYDYENRIVLITDSYGSPVVVFGYDALGRRILKAEMRTNGTRFYYYNADWQILSEQDYSLIINQYVYGSFIDEAVVMSGERYENESIKCYSNANYFDSCRSICE